MYLLLQLGISKRICVVKLRDEGILVLVNPEITERGGSTSIVEGCLSLPLEKVEVTRSQWVTVKYTSLEGTATTLTENDLNAIIIQHEIDHLNGVLIID